MLNAATGPASHTPVPFNPAIPNMKKLLLLIPLASALSSCTTNVVKPEPPTTVTREETTVHSTGYMPRASETTTTVVRPY